MRPRAAAKALLAVVLVCGIGVIFGGGCSPTIAEQAKSSAADLEELAAAAKGEKWELEKGLGSETISREDLLALSAVGVSTGDQVDHSVAEMDQGFRGTGLFSEEELERFKSEMKKASCYIYSWYLEHGVPPENALEAEEALYGYIESRIITQPFGAKIEGAVQEIGKAVRDAGSPGEAAANVAIITACF